MYESNFKQVNAIQKLVNNYIEDGALAKVDVLIQVTDPLIEESYIESNIKARCEMGLYSGNYQIILRDVQADIAKNIAPLNSKELFQLKEIIDFFVSKYCTNRVERHVEYTIESLSNEKKQFLSLFLQLYRLEKTGSRKLGFPTIFELKDFYKTCNLALGIQEEDADKWLLGTGLVNKYLFNSNNITANHWEVTLWGINSIDRLAQNSAEYGIPEFTYHELKEVISHSYTNPFIEWVLEKLNSITNGIIEYPVWNEGKHVFDNNYGSGAFENILARLVKVGAISIHSNTARKFSGYHININPEVLALLS